MFSYATLDTIADAYIPLLGGLSLGFVAAPLIRGAWRLARGRLAMVFSGLVCAYGLLLIDNQFGTWASFGMDFSTHSAVALVLIMFLMFCATRLSLLWLISLAAYALLMLYQGYHTLADIVTTSLVVVTAALPAMATINWTMLRSSRSIPPAQQT